MVQYSSTHRMVTSSNPVIQQNQYYPNKGLFPFLKCVQLIQVVMAIKEVCCFVVVVFNYLLVTQCYTEDSCRPAIIDSRQKQRSQISFHALSFNLNVLSFNHALNLN